MAYFDVSDYNFSGNGVFGTAAKDAVTNIDFKVPDTGLYLQGGEIMTKDAVLGDWIEVQVIDIDNILGLGANRILMTYMAKWFINPDNYNRIEVDYASSPLKDLYIRIVYHSTGTSVDVKVAANYYLHKKK